jgi:phospholipid/cholesterol/gamma-HCH transport system permease protein
MAGEDTAERPFDMELVPTGAGRAELRLRGELTFANAAPLWSDARGYVERPGRGDTLDFDMSQVRSVDGGAMALLTHLRTELQQRGVKSEFVAAPPRIQQIIHLYRGDVRPGRRKRRKPQGTLDQLGKATMGIVYEVQLVLAFFGQMMVSALGALREPKTVNWRELTPTMERAGADAIPIVMLINFLVGMVTAFQASVQLKKYGADIFVADMVGLSMTRELGPLMTAIVVCGRSGAAFAAELGTMKVNEEIDALRTMGFGPMRFLVLPRAWALMFVMPLLTLMADAMGVLGGLCVAVFSLDIGIVGYLHQTQKVVQAWDVYQGLCKSVVFALAIALIACQQGLAASGGAEAVGRRTTASVVITLFTLILIDATFTVFLHAFSS